MDLSKPGRWKAHITAKREIAKGTMEASLWLDGPAFEYQAGQYVKLSISRLLLSDPAGNSRDFSIASSPAQGNLITIAFRISDSAFKQALIAAPEGTPVDVHGPLGVFTLPEDAAQPLVFIAGGIGITPFLSMLRRATEKKLPYAITLLYANTSPESAAYIPELEALAKQNSRFILKNKSGVLDAPFIQQNVPDPINAHWYIAGPPGMVAAVRTVLMQMYVHEESMATEEFSGYDIEKTAAGSELARPELVEWAESAAAVPVEPSTAFMAPAKAVLDEKKNEIEKFASGLDVLSLSQENLQAILEALNSSALVSLTDLEGTITYANDKFIEVSQYSRKELIGQNHRILKSGFHEQSFYNDMWHEHLLKGKVWRGEIKNKKKDGTFYWVDADIAPIFDRKGVKIGYMGIRFPITERKKAEESASLFSNILKQTTQAWGMADMEGMMLDANDAFVLLLGYSKNELQAMNYGSLIESIDRAKVQAGTKQAVETRQPFAANAIFLKKDGSKITVALTVNGYFENNAPRYVYAFITDITKERNAMEDSQNTNLAMMNILEDARALDEKLQKEQERLKAVISSMGEGIIVIDAHNGIILMNEATERMLEVPSQKTLGKDLRIVFPALLKDGKIILPEERPAMQAIRTGMPVVSLLSDNYQYQLPSGRKLSIAFIVTPLKGNDGNVYGAVIVFRDITEERKLNATRETFISIASHQLRTPLTSIRWYTEMLSAGDAGPLSDKQKIFLDNIYTGILRLSETLNMLLSLTRIESGRVKKELVEIDLETFTQDIIKELVPYSNAKNLKIDVSVENASAAKVKMDASMLREVITNLLSNAIRYTENKTDIHVRIGLKADHWLYSVADSGIGIAEENKSRIFEKFFRADNAVALVPDGNGLGLTLAKDLVESWDGKVWFESALGKGTTFYFTIPFAEAENR